MTATEPSPPGDGRAERPVAVVTGANRGIGRDVARQLAGHGFVVIAGARDPGQGERTARQLDPAGGTVIALQLDVTDPATIEAAAGWTAPKGRGADWTEERGTSDEGRRRLQAPRRRKGSSDLGVVREALDTNLLGAWRTTQAFLPLLRRSAHPRIVNVSSEAGSISEMTGGTPAYSVSKAALNALTRLLAGELRADRILVNAVCPGWTDTDMGQGGRPVADGAASVMWAALLPDDGPTGGFYRDGQPLRW